jgi:hypothetical protein
VAELVTVGSEGRLTLPAQSAAEIPPDTFSND